MRKGEKLHGRVCACACACACARACACASITAGLLHAVVHQRVHACTYRCSFSSSLAHCTGARCGSGAMPVTGSTATPSSSSIELQHDGESREVEGGRSGERNEGCIIRPKAHGFLAV